MTPEKDEPHDLLNRSLQERRVRDLSVALPLLGILLLATPIKGIFATDMSIFGVPMPFLFLFGCWLVLILIARRLSRRLISEREE